MANDMKYWDSGFPIATEDAASTNDMKYWDNGFPFVYIGLGGSTPPSYTLKLRNGLARASIKEINGLAIASFKSRNELT